MNRLIELLLVLVRVGEAIFSLPKAMVGFVVTVVLYFFIPNNIQYFEEIRFGIFSIGVICAVSVLSFLGSPVLRRWQIDKCLKSLSKGEKNLLRSYINDNSKTKHMFLSDGVVNSLIASRILYRASDYHTVSGRYPINIEPDVWNALKKNSTLLD